MPTTNSAVNELLTYADPVRAEHSKRFFKTGKGQYGEGQKFLGVTVPQIRLIARHHSEIDFVEIKTLLESEWHEVKLMGLIILVNKYKKAKFHAEKLKIVDFYVDNMQYVNNWDLVDSSAHYILGAYIYDHPGYYGSLKSLARSPGLWKRRIAIISTFYFIKKGSSKECFEICDMLINDKEDLIHKATGWMLREVGKNCGESVLKDYLRTRYKRMPRTELRYAIEKLQPEIRKQYLTNKI